MWTCADARQVLTNAQSMGQDTQTPATSLHNRWRTVQRALTLFHVVSCFEPLYICAHHHHASARHMTPCLAQRVRGAHRRESWQRAMATPTFGPLPHLTPCAIKNREPSGQAMVCRLVGGRNK